MKKIALFSLICCLGMLDSALARTCGGATLTYVGTQAPDHDEFLYVNEREYNNSVGGYNKGTVGSGVKNSGAGTGIECDELISDACIGGEIKTMQPGHVFKGKVVNHTARYQCDTSDPFDDKWVEITESCVTEWGTLAVGRAFKNKTEADCSNIRKTETNLDAVKVWQVICRAGGELVCKPTKCKDGYKLDDKNGKCIKECKDCDKTCEQKYKGNQAAIDCCNAGQDWNADSKRCICKEKSLTWNPSKKQCEEKSNGGGNTTPKKTCKELYGKYPERLACCEAGKATKWTGSVKDGTCSCVDTTKVWDSAKKQCVTPEKEEVSEFSNCIYEYDVSIKCANGNTYHEKGAERLKKTQLAEFTCEDFNSRFGKDVKKWQELYGDLCKDEPDLVVVPPAGPDPYKVQQAQKTLAAFTASAKDEASVWKTAEGKFNTTRLASDITAGVVLGTVGGVVTGNVIKKNQVKKGFEALHCTVGGQKVADWGDEFSVGLQR